MKKLVATVLSILVFITVSLPSLPSFFPDYAGYFDRYILCHWFGRHERDFRINDAIAAGEPICSQSIPASPHYQYRKYCVDGCETFSIVDHIFQRAVETASELKEEFESVFSSHPQSAARRSIR